MARRRGMVATLARMQREAQRAQADRARDAARFQRDAQRAQAASARAAVADERQRQRMYVEARTAEAAEDTTEVEQIVASLTGLLAATLDVDDFLDLETLKRPPPRPMFDPSVAGPLGPPPRLDDYLPPPVSGTGRMFGAARHAEQTRQAHARYDQRAAAHRAQVQQHAANLDQARRRHDAEVARLTAEHQQRVADIEDLQRGLAANQPDAVVRYLDLVLERAEYPDGFPHSWRLVYTPTTRQLAVEYELPTVGVVPTAKAYRYVKASDSVTSTARSQAQIRSLYTAVIAQTALRVVHEVLEADRAGHVASVVLNAYTTAPDPASGRNVSPCLVALGTTRRRFLDLDLAHVDPVLCLQHLEADLSRDPSKLLPVEPMARFDTLDLSYSTETDPDAGTGPGELDPGPAPAITTPRPPTTNRPAAPASGAAAQQLAPGQNTPLTGPVLDVSLSRSWSAPADLSVLLLGADGRVATDSDFIFFNQPRSTDGAVALRGGDNPDGATVDLSRIPDRYSRLVLVASASDQTSSVAGAALAVLDPTATPDRLGFQPTDTTAMPALLCAEIYRRNGTWRLRAIGQGYRDGLAGLARDYGVDVN